MAPVFITRYVALNDLSCTLSAGTKVKGASPYSPASQGNTGSLCDSTRCKIMANDQDKTGQQGGITQNNPGSFENDPHRPSEPGQRGGQTLGSDPQRELPQGGQDLGGGNQSDHHGSAGAAHQGGMGGHTTGPKSDNGQSEIDEASQAVQDEDSGMTEDNR